MGAEHMVTNGNAMSVNGATSASLKYDIKGKVNIDGTASHARRTRITHDGRSLSARSEAARWNVRVLWALPLEVLRMNGAQPADHLPVTMKEWQFSLGLDRLIL